ncbi:hypothetical protein B9Z55_001663 [Caenorhabditis nigoni]|uniref:Uncharacterized protein n=1 Tax=Caenorhabditis nigoni TaxID=1611254 RepID=A0A2G5VGP5_9PELO|nr:hypothetical protein B9Z55_001663 [Caenorhabditis nigoni]
MPNRTAITELCYLFWFFQNTHLGGVSYNYDAHCIMMNVLSANHFRYFSKEPIQICSKGTISVSHQLVIFWFMCSFFIYYGQLGNDC